MAKILCGEENNTGILLDNLLRDNKALRMSHLKYIIKSKKY